MSVRQATSVSCLVLVDPERCLLAAQRPEGKALAGHWEFPGGKVETNETAEAALRREIREELGYNPGTLQALEPVLHYYPFGAICLFPFLGRCEARPNLHVHEHTAVQWVAVDALNQLTWAPADLPIIAQLRNLV